MTESLQRRSLLGNGCFVLWLTYSRRTLLFYFQCFKKKGLIIILIKKLNLHKCHMTFFEIVVNGNKKVERVMDHSLLNVLPAGLQFRDIIAWYEKFIVYAFGPAQFLTKKYPLLMLIYVRIIYKSIFCIVFH